MLYMYGMHSIDHKLQEVVAGVSSSSCRPWSSSLIISQLDTNNVLTLNDYTHNR